eukprot:scaffold436_cov367-Prasinococcus_capsulatus_cf.AAC.5
MLPACCLDTPILADKPSKQEATELTTPGAVAQATRQLSLAQLYILSCTAYKAGTHEAIDMRCTTLQLYPIASSVGRARSTGVPTVVANEHDCTAVDPLISREGSAPATSGKT